MHLKQQLINATSKLPLIVYYQGNYKDVPTEAIINMIESNERSANRKSQLRKLMFLTVEAIQNIQRYSAHQNYQTDFSLIYCDGDSYQVITQNLIFNKDSEELKKRLDAVISKSTEELDEVYMARIESEERTEKGAGLGLIEMARRSNNNIRYDLKKINEDFTLFNFCIAIPVEKKAEFTADFSQAITIQKDLEQFSKSNKSSFYYGGDFSNNFISSLLNLLLSKGVEEKNNTNKKVHHVLIELIQNIKRHALLNSGRSDGRLFVEWKDKCIEVSTYNAASINNASELQKKVVNLNDSSKEQLNEKSKEILSNLEVTNGLGLIDVANLIYPNKIEVSINNEDLDHADLLFTIRINNG